MYLTLVIGFQLNERFCWQTWHIFLIRRMYENFAYSTNFGNGEKPSYTIVPVTLSHTSGT
jgi:hypothetical protein